MIRDSSNADDTVVSFQNEMTTSSQQDLNRLVLREIPLFKDLPSSALDRLLKGMYVFESSPTMESCASPPQSSQAPMGWTERVVWITGDGREVDSDPVPPWGQCYKSFEGNPERSGADIPGDRELARMIRI